MLSDGDPFCDIFSQPTSQASGRSHGKFQPKAKKKIENSLPSSPNISTKTSQHNDNDVSDNNHPSQVKIGISPAVSLEKQTEASGLLPQSKELSEDKVLSSIHDGKPADTSNVHGHGPLSADTPDTIFSSHSALTEVPFKQIHLDSLLPGGAIDSEFTGDISSSERSFDDVMIEPVSSVKTLGKIKPKGSMQHKRKLPLKKTAFTPDITNSIEASIGLCSNPIDDVSKHQINKLSSDDVHPTKKESAKKKFPHSTQRKRRQVDKLLLETPEHEIDERKIPIKDLILLAEAREKLSTKEAATMQQSKANNSSGQGLDDHFFNQESIYGEGQGPDFDEEHEATPQTEQSSIKFNYHSFMNKVRTPRWSKVETESFYQAIRQFGTDFAMIQQLFPTRTRHQIKLKFKSEERKHPLQIADALVSRTKDVSKFEVVIQQLQAQAAQNSNMDAEDNEGGYEMQDTDIINKSEEVGKSEQGEEFGANGLDHQVDEDVNDLEQSPRDMKYSGYESVFDFSEFGNDGFYGT